MKNNKRFLVAVFGVFFLFAGYGVYHFWRLHIAVRIRPVFLWIDNTDNETALAVMIIALMVIIVIWAVTRGASLPKYNQ